MDEETKVGCAALAFGIFIGFCVGISWMAQCVPNTKAASVDAVKHGAGRWVTDDYGNVKFEWTTTKEK